MKKKMSFGNLGTIEITTLTEQAVDILAKYTSSQATICTNGGYTDYYAGPNFSDDQTPCQMVSAIE